MLAHLGLVLFNLLLLPSIAEIDILAPPKPDKPSHTPPSQLDKEGCFEDNIDWSSASGDLKDQPTVFLAIIARNVEHMLHNYLGYIDNLDYPKERMTVW